MESPGKMRMAPAPMMISGDGMGTMTCSIITPMKTENWPWVLIKSIIHCVISEINSLSNSPYFITSDKNPVKEILRSYMFVWGHECFFDFHNQNATLCPLWNFSLILSSTFKKTPQLCCGDEPSNYKIVRGEWPKIIFLRGLIPRRKVLDLLRFLYPITNNRNILLWIVLTVY